MSAVDNTLDYIDQASFLGLRALGHGPVIQFTWIYGRDIDLDGLRRFHHNLGHGLLGRRIERSPLPFGRHRWIAWPGLDIDVASRARPRKEFTAWTDEQSSLPIDPEFGPSWRLAVQNFTNGQTAVTLVVSHTVADGVGIAIAVTDAAKGTARNLGYPAGGSRTKTQALVDDSRAIVRTLPQIARALAAAVRVAVTNGGIDSPGRPATSNPAEDPGEVVTLCSVTAYVDVQQWDERAKSLGGTSNSLFLGIAAQIGQRLGWVEHDGTVTLSIPVNERIDGDTRGNALTSVRLTADPSTVADDLTDLRAGLKAALSTLGEAHNQLVAPLPLTPIVPKVVARRLEGMVVGGALLGSSNLGDLDPAVNRPDGTEADFFAVRMNERIDRAHLRRQDGVFFPVVSARLHGRVSVSVGYMNAHGTTTAAELLETVRGVFADFGLSGIIE
jgi:diacylglycerol O-acyltransferase